jgi:hypothetical protein
LELGLEPLDSVSGAMYGMATRTYKVESRKEQKATSKGRRIPQISPIIPPPDLVLVSKASAADRGDG